MASISPSISDVEGSGVTLKSGSALLAARASERAVAQQAYASDPKFKKYTQQVEKCLSSFDSVHEWADFIAFLKQLLKTFQSYMQFKEIPRKLIVAKRLAQCLNPALPTGVHQRALDVYAHILAVLGSEGLKRDLALWSSGLFPFFEYAATSVKPTLLNLYDTHYLPLQAGLRPIMKSFILALLPGLEEETGEFFEKVLSLLDRLSGTVSPSFFFQNIWLVMLTTPSARGTSLNLLSRRLPRLKPNDDIVAIVGDDVGLMIRAFAAALEDENLLVRRGALDLLLQSMRVDSLAIQRAQVEDRAIIMSAAMGVVLRRDLSLNRRLYTWLLGPDEKRDAQVVYFRKHALELLKETLRDEMISPSGEYSESRPFKIFISLLDKWEIGGPLTEVLAYDAFKAIKYLVDIHPDSRDEILMTASTLYEAVEPQILWKHILGALFNETLSTMSKSEAMGLVKFVLKSFAQDEDIQTVHLPTIFAGCLDLIHLHFSSQPLANITVHVLECLELQEEVLRHIPHSALMHPPGVVPEVEQTRATQRPYQFACTFYGLVPQFASTSQGTSSVPFASAFEILISLSTHFATRITNPISSAIPSASNFVREAFGQVLLLTDRLIGRLGTSKTINVSWKPREWLKAVLSTFEPEHYKSISFTIVDRAVGLMVVLSQMQGLQPPLLGTVPSQRPSGLASGLSTPTLASVVATSNAQSKETFVVSQKEVEEERRMYTQMVKKLLYYLESDYAAYHLRAVSLIWAIEDATQGKAYVESIIAQSLTVADSRRRQGAFDAFGVLWRLTEDHLLPGFRFKVPLMIVLDALSSDDPHLRRTGETWMRCSLKAFSRVLDPILYDLLEPTVRRRQIVIKIRGRELQGYEYERPFDQRFMNHLLKLLQSVAQFGAQAFAKTIQSVHVRRSHHSGLVQRIDAAGFAHTNATYLDVLTEILLQFLRSEPCEAGQTPMNPLNTHIQYTTIELLQTIVARGEIDIVSVETIEAVVVSKLFFCVHTKRLDLQNKLLHLLHSLISVMASYEAMSIANAANKPYEGFSDQLNNGETADSARAFSINPLLTQTLMDGISSSSNRPVLQHWLDFVLMTVPQFQPALQPLIILLSDCMHRQLLLALAELHVTASSSPSSNQDVRSSTTDAEFTMLLNGLERLILLSLAHTAWEPSHIEDETGTLEKSVSESTGLLGYVSGVFGADTQQPQSEEQLVVKSVGYKTLHEGVKVLYLVWSTLDWTNPEQRSSKDDSLSLIYNRTRARARRVLEHLFRAQSAEVFESIVDWWNRDLGFSVPVDSAFVLVDLLMSSAQNAVHMMCECILFRMTGVSEKSRKQTINPDLTDVVLFKFMEQYLQRLEGPLAVQVWNRFLQLVKDITSSAKDSKMQSFLALRCLAVLSEKITQTTALEDKRVKKELQDNFGKLLDSCVAFVGRSSDSGFWLRRGNKDALTNGRDSPAPRDLKLDEKADASSVSLPAEVPTKVNSEVDLITQINQFLATTGLPNLRRFFMDNDKVASACANIVYYIIGPAMKGKIRPMDIDENALIILYEMTRLPGVLKAWRPPVQELLNDNRLFSCSVEAAIKWRPIIKTLFDADKTAMPELLAKVATATSANIFTNKEYEMLLRSLNVRRLAYILFVAEKNQFLTQLPTIQEKLVDILRNVSSPVVQSEAFLCIRVLLCRLSPHNLTSFWPVLFTELYRIFEQVITTLPADGSEDLQLVLAACKCLDLLLVLQTEEFQIHQWVFITDTVDAIYRPDNWFPEAMMDQLAEIANSLPVVNKQEEKAGTLGPQTPALSNHRHMRRPMLNTLHHIDSIRDLVPFFSAVSISSYESVYASGGNIDWDEVEKGIMNETFDA